MEAPLNDDDGDGSPSSMSQESDGRPAPQAGPESRSDPRWKSKGSRTRRSSTIHAYIGANGHGKSLAMMHDTKLSIDRGRPILSTVRVLDPRKPWNSIAGYPTYDGFEQLNRWSQLLDFSNGDVLFDEVLGVAASASGAGSLPEEVKLLLNQLRRRDILLRWTAPAWSRANIVLREVTQAVTVCRGYSPRYENRGDDSRLWGQNRLFRWTTYDAIDFATWTDNKEANLKGLANAWAWRETPWYIGGVGSASWAAASYDTYDAVSNVDSGTGYCFVCKGERAKPRRSPCSC